MNDICGFYECGLSSFTTYDQHVIVAASSPVNEGWAPMAAQCSPSVSTNLVQVKVGGILTWGPKILGTASAAPVILPAKQLLNQSYHDCQNLECIFPTSLFRM